MRDPVLFSLLRINGQRLRALKKDLLPYQYMGVMHLIALYVNHHPGASQEEIVSYFALDKGSVARDAKHLEDLGHMERVIDPTNRRQYRLYLTTEGEKMVSVIENSSDRFLQSISAGISEDEWMQLTNLLEKLEKNCGSEPPPGNKR